MRKFEYHDINEIGHPSNFMDNKPHPRFGYAQGLLKLTNPILISNFMKVAKWIKENCPNLNGEFNCKHQVYYKIDLIVENGKAYLCTGSHSVGYELYLSSTETAIYSQGSCQSNPYAFENIFFFRNDRLEEFLSQWQTLKRQIICTYRIQCNVYSENFTA